MFVAVALPPGAVAVENERLPDLGAPSELEGLAKPSLVDPLSMDGRVDLEVVRRRLAAQVEQAALSASPGRPLARDWSNFWSHTAAANALFDLQRILRGVRTQEQLTDTVEAWFGLLLSEEAESWHLGSAVDLQSRVPPVATFSSRILLLISIAIQLAFGSFPIDRKWSAASFLDIAAMFAMSP